MVFCLLQVVEYERCEARWQHSDQSPCLQGLAQWSTSLHHTRKGTHPQSFISTSVSPQIMSCSKPYLYLSPAHDTKAEPYQDPHHPGLQAPHNRFQRLLLLLQQACVPHGENVGQRSLLPQNLLQVLPLQLPAQNRRLLTLEGSRRREGEIFLLSSLSPALPLQPRGN